MSKDVGITDDQQRRGQLSSQDANRRARRQRADPPHVPWDEVTARFAAYLRERDAQP